MNEMGMTDKQFNAYNRQLLDRIKEIAELLKNGNTKEAIDKVENVADSLQKTIED